MRRLFAPALLCAALVTASLSGTAGAVLASPATLGGRPAAPVITAVTRVVTGGFKVTWKAVPRAQSYLVFTQVERYVDLGTGTRHTVDAMTWRRVGAVTGGHTSFTTADSLWPNRGIAPAFAVSVVTPAGGSAISASRVAGCASAYFISARGSGENPAQTSTGLKDHGYAKGLGRLGYHTYTQALGRLNMKRSTLQALAVDYPARRVTGWTPPPFDYPQSERAGASQTAFLAGAVVAGCPRARIVLFGFSQGAQAVGDGFQQLTAGVKQHISRVILFADAARNRTDGAITYQPNNPDGGGVMPDRGHFTGLSDVRQVESWCWGEDLVCGQGWHPHGQVYDCYAAAAARNLALRARHLGWRPYADTSPACDPLLADRPA